MLMCRFLQDIFFHGITHERRMLLFTQFWTVFVTNIWCTSITAVFHTCSCILLLLIGYWCPRDSVYGVQLTLPQESCGRSRKDEASGWFSMVWVSEPVPFSVSMLMAWWPERHLACKNKNLHSLFNGRRKVKSATGLHRWKLAAQLVCFYDCVCDYKRQYENFNEFSKQVIY